MKKTIIVLISSFIFLSGSAYAGGFMGADEIKSLVSGKTVSGKGLKKDFTLTTYHAPDGGLVGVKNGEQRAGTWSVQDDGQHCVEFDDGKGNCRLIKDNGDGTYSRVKVKGNGKKISVVLWESIEDGNTVK